MNEIENWSEVTKGLYRYVIASNVAYEIHIIHWDHDTDILTAKASLYIIGEWVQSNENTYTERECLLSGRPLFECLAAAIEDDKKNNLEVK